jgi:hypothetical protein
MATVEEIASNKLDQVAEAQPTSSVKNVIGTTQSAMDSGPTPEISVSGVTNNAPVASPRVTKSSALEKSTASPTSASHATTDTSRRSVPSPTGSDPVATASERLTVGNSTPPQLTTPNAISPTVDDDSLPLADNEMTDNPPLPMLPPTRPDMTAAKDGQSDTRDSNSQQLDNPLSPRGTTPTMICRQPTPSQDGTSEADKQLGASSPQVETSRTTAITMDSAPIHRLEKSCHPHSTTDALKTHTSGLSEPDIDSLLELIRDDDGFEEESKPQRDKVIEAIVAVRNASPSEEWTNLLRGVIILTICLGFPKGNVSETHICLRLALTNNDRKMEVNSQHVTARTNASFGCSIVGGTTPSHRTSRIGLKSLAVKCGSG